MYLFLAFFWLAIGGSIQLFWSDVEPLLRERGLSVDRTLMGFLCFVLFGYNFIRWRMGQMLRRARQKDQESRHRPRRADREPDSTLDFSDPKPPDERIQKPPRT